MQYLTIGISLLALLVSGVTLWLTQLWRGTLRMTRPAVIYFCPVSEKTLPTVYLRTLLYSTGKRGIVLEHLFIRLRRGETQQNFNVWVYGPENDLARGSGLFVDQAGIATSHCFLPLADIKGFDFAAGDYELEVFGKIIGKDTTLLLYTIRLSIDTHEAEQLRKPDHGIYFDWGPDSRRYQKKIKEHSSKATDPFKLLEALQYFKDPHQHYAHDNEETTPS